MGCGGGTRIGQGGRRENGGRSTDGAHTLNVCRHPQIVGYTNGGSCATLVDVVVVTIVTCIPSRVTYVVATDVNV